MYARLIPLLSACTLSACMQYTEITTPPQPVNYTSGSVARAVTGTTETEIRTVRSGAATGGNDTEFSGANCKLQGRGFEAQVTSPAIVLLPTFNGSADPLTMTCAANGQTVATVSNPRNLTRDRLNNPVPTTGGLIGAIATSVAVGVIAASRDPLQDNYAYGSRIIGTFGLVQ